MSSSSQTGSNSCLGCLGLLFFLIFVLPSLIGGIIDVASGRANVSLKNCSLKMGNGISVSCNPEITSKYSFWDMTQLERRKQIAKEAIQEFHADLKQGKCQNFYHQTSQSWQKEIDREKFSQFCNSIVQRSGAIQSFKLVRWEWLPSNSEGAEYVRVHSEIHSTTAKVTEVSVWELKNNQAFLADYGLE